MQKGNIYPNVKIFYIFLDCGNDHKKKFIFTSNLTSISSSSPLQISKPLTPFLGVMSDEPVQLKRLIKTSLSQIHSISITLERNAFYKRIHKRP